RARPRARARGRDAVRPLHGAAQPGLAQGARAGHGEGRMSPAAAALGRLGPLLLVAAAWQAASGRLIDAAFLPSVGTIGDALIDLARDGALAMDLAITLFRSLAGLLAATVAGTALGIWMATSARVDRWVGPL